MIRSHLQLRKKGGGSLGMISLISFPNSLSLLLRQVLELIKELSDEKKSSTVGSRSALGLSLPGGLDGASGLEDIGEDDEDDDERGSNG